MERPPERIVSLAPSATATLAHLGVADRVVGTTTHGALDRREVGGWLTPDLDAVDRLDPDLVVTVDDLQASVRDAVRARGHRVCHLTPATMAEVLASFRTLAGAVGVPAAGDELVGEARRRLDAHPSPPPGDRPVVYCEEWSDPPMAAGNWVPDAVTAAGGSYPFVAAGDRSRRTDPDAVAAAEPDHVVLHICGRGDQVDPATVAARDWLADAAVHVVHDDLLNQPSPRLLDGVDELARICHG